MAVTRAKDSSVNTGTKYISFLAGNPPQVLGGYESIASSVVSGSSTSTVTFSGFGSTYASLQIRYIARDTTGGTGGVPIYLYLNGVNTGTAYAYHNLTGTGSAASAGGAASQSRIALGGTTAAMVPTAGDLASTFAAGIIDLHDYTAARNRTIRFFGGYSINGTGDAVALGSGLYASTTAVTSITLQAFGFFAAGSMFSLYGVKSA